MFAYDYIKHELSSALVTGRRHFFAYADGENFCEETKKKRNNCNECAGTTCK
jgi:hypothetical protein